MKRIAWFLVLAVCLGIVPLAVAPVAAISNSQSAITDSPIDNAVGTSAIMGDANESSMSDLFVTESVATCPGTVDRDRAVLLASFPITGGMMKQPGQQFDKGWRMKNTGTTVWEGYSAVRVAGDFGPESIAVGTTKPGATVDIWARGIITPDDRAGLHRAVYQLKGPEGNFGIWFSVDIMVIKPIERPNQNQNPHDNDNNNGRPHENGNNGNGNGNGNNNQHPVHNQNNNQNNNQNQHRR